MRNGPSAASGFNSVHHPLRASHPPFRPVMPLRSGPRCFPMLAVVRLEHIKHALLLGAVDTGELVWCSWAKEGRRTLWGVARAHQACACAGGGRHRSAVVM